MCFIMRSLVLLIASWRILFAMGAPALEAACYDYTNRSMVLSGTRAVLQPPEGGFYVVTVLDKNNIWAVGREGHHHSVSVSSVILNSTDLGYTWTRKAIVLNQYLFDIYFLTPLTGWAVGSEGLILRTTDGGQNWTRHKPPIGDESLISVRFISDKKGWAIGRDGRVLRTSDGGSTWRSQILPAGWVGREFKGWLNSFSFADESNGWVVGDGEHIYQSADGGANWQSRASQVRLLIKAGKVRCINYKAVRFFNKDAGYLIAELNVDCDADPGSRKLVILKTVNGGKDWVIQRILIAPCLHKVQFLTEMEWWMDVPSHPEEFLLHTTDAGKTWSKVKVTADSGLGLVVFLDSNTGLSLSYEDGFSDYNMVTRDGGRTWVRYQIKYITQAPR